MIEINLLPDIKREYLRSQRVKRYFMLGTAAAVVLAIASAILMGIFILGQNIHLGNLQEDIDSGVEQLQNVSDLDKVVTVQNQLASIQGLYDDKPQADLLLDYLTLITPNDIDLGSVEVNFDEPGNIEISGVGPGFKEVNVFVDTLKNAEFTFEGSGGPQKAFSGVVLSSSGASPNSDENGFKIVMTFDPAIFDNNLKKLKLRIPNITSTQSETERPKSLFDPSAQQQPAGEGS